MIFCASQHKDGFVVLTESYLKKRKFCCGAQCLNCPYEPQYKKGATKINRIRNSIWNRV